MPVAIHFTRDLAGNLKPADAESAAAILEMKTGAVYRADVVLPRNYKRLKWWWKLCGIVADNSDLWPSSKAVSDMLKLKCGHFDTIVVPGRKPGEWTQQYVPGSIAFASMEEPDFKALCEQAVLICAQVLGTTSTELNDALHAFFAGPQRKPQEKAS